MATQRKNAFHMSLAEQTAYIASVTAMIASGKYLDLVNIHKDMKHRMHNMTGTDIVGQLRFLSWHRAFLMEFETELQKLDKNTFVPYWKWVEGGVPTWLTAFKPTVNGVVNKRNNLTSPITDQARINFVLARPDYPTFTRELESDPHNQGHNALGEPMKWVPLSPSDPIFWMHHGEVDRIWTLWQAANPGKGPLLSGADADMDPFAGKNVTNLGTVSYTYV